MYLSLSGLWTYTTPGDTTAARALSIDWQARYQRVTQRLAHSVAALWARLSVAYVAEFFELHWRTVREIDWRRLRESLGELAPAQPCRLIVDEFALHKGHRYARVVLYADTKRVLWIGLGRSQSAVTDFLPLWGMRAVAESRASL